MSNKSFTNFPTRTTLKEPRHVKKYRISLDNQHGKLLLWFSEFGKINKTLHLFPIPSNKIIKHWQKSCRQNWLISSVWQFGNCWTAWVASLSAAKFPNTHMMWQRMQMLFGSLMDIIKAPYRSQVSVDLRFILRIPTTKAGNQHHTSL